MTERALPPLGVGPRLARVRRLVDDRALSGLLVTSLTNIRYLTGFTGSAAVLLVLADRSVMITDGRYEEQALDELAAAGSATEVVVATYEHQPREMARAAAAAATVGFEESNVTVAQHRSLADWFPQSHLVGTQGIVEQLREVKDLAELARIEEAARIADEALYAIRPLLTANLTEAAVALALDSEMRRLGADGPAFETIVASGPNSAKAHHRPSRRTIEPGDLVIIDFGARLDGYRSDCTRTFSIGRLTGQKSEIFGIVAEAQALGVAAVRAGRHTREIDAACRDHIAHAGYGDRFTHGTGHGVGLDIHEAPRVAAPVADTLVARQVVTVEPGIYLPGLGGVRIEDSVVVTADACRPITLFPKDPELI